jgi:hypothetical protein
MRVAAVLTGLVLLAACTGEQDTPADVMAQYAQLKAGLDPGAIGQSIQRLEAFETAHARYRIAAPVRGDIAQLRKQASERFHLARELARGADLARAEKILNDLATTLPDTDPGRMAKAFMQFDFPMLKAGLLMTERRFTEVDETMRRLLTTDLTAVQTSQVERVLDAVHAAVLASLDSACHRLRVALRGGVRPGWPLSKRALAGAPARGGSRGPGRDRGIPLVDRELSGRGRFSFVAVGKDGKTRRRVTEKGGERW